MSLLAIDYGKKRTGLACVPTGSEVVLPFGVCVETKTRTVLDQIQEKIQDIQPECIIIGLPLDMEGNETEMSRRVRAFGELLEQRVRIPVQFVDERFTTAQGKRMEGGVGDDEKAAMVILETYLATKV